MFFCSCVSAWNVDICFYLFFCSCRWFTTTSALKLPLQRPVPLLVGPCMSCECKWLSLNCMCVCILMHVVDRLLMFTPQFFTPTSALFEIACHNKMKNIFKQHKTIYMHVCFVNPGGCKPWRRERLGSVFAPPIYIYMLTCNLSGEEGSEEKPREGSWGIGCLCLLLGGLRFLTDRLQGQQQGRQKGNLLLQVQGQDQRQTGLQENARIDSHKLQQYVSKINFILSGQWWSSMEWWEAGGMCWVILLICSIFTMWWFMLQLLLSQVAAGNVSADAVDSLAEAII